MAVPPTERLEHMKTTSFETTNLALPDIETAPELNLFCWHCSAKMTFPFPEMLISPPQPAPQRNWTAPLLTQSVPFVSEYWFTKVKKGADPVFESDAKPENRPAKFVVEVSEVIVNVAGAADVMHT